LLQSNRDLAASYPRQVAILARTEWTGVPASDRGRAHCSPEALPYCRAFGGHQLPQRNHLAQLLILATLSSPCRGARLQTNFPCRRL